jgi:Ca-activated chloride channel family protein
VTFADPELLLGLLLVPLALAAYVLVQRRRSRYAVRFTNVDLLANLAPVQPSWRRHVPTALYLAAIAALSFALARPSMVLAVPRQDATVMLAIDTSRSMIANDVSPTRLGAATQAAGAFLDQLPAGFRVGLVAFSTEARLVVAPTTDHAQVRDALASLQANGGTALGDAIGLALQATADVRSGAAAQAGAPAASPGAAGATPAPQSSTGGGAASPPLVATVLLSDGANSTGSLTPQQAADEAAAAGMPVYTIALGTSNATVEAPDQYGQLHQLSAAPDPQTLAAVAETTSGRFFQAPSAGDLQQIYQSLGSKMDTVDQTQEVTQWFAAAGLLLVVVGGGLAAVWFNRFP